jgi:flagellar basal body-associated protein FliL
MLLKFWVVFGSFIIFLRKFIGFLTGLLKIYSKYLKLYGCDEKQDSLNKRSFLADKETVKQQFLSRLEGCRNRAQFFKQEFLKLWQDPEKALLFRGLVFVIFFTSFVWLASGLYFLNHLSQASRSLASIDEPEEVFTPVVDEAGEVASGGGGLNAIVGMRPIPREIRNRQNGIPEPDKDLVEVEIRRGRGLAAISPSAQVEEPVPYNPFVSYNEILGSTSEQAAHVGRVAMDIAFEVQNFGAMRELREREKEIKFVISSLVAEFTYDILREEEGRLALKKRIFREVNYLLKDGQIRDVLYSNIVMK